MNALRVLQLLTLALGGVTFTVPNSRADEISFPQAPADAASAAANFDERAKIVTRYNACGRELDYANYRQEQRDQNYAHQGEELTSILIAKIAWLTDPRFVDTPCKHHLTVQRPTKPDGSLVHRTAEEFKTETLRSWMSECSFPGSTFIFFGDKIELDFFVTQNCLRQQVNDAIRAMVKDKQMGTPIPCLSPQTIVPELRKGDWDVNVRDLVRVLYMGTKDPQVLDRSTIEHMYRNLLAAQGPPSDDTYSPLYDCDEPAGDQLGTPEDWADRQSWYRELLDSIGDVLKWLFELAKLEVVRTAASMLNPLGPFPTTLVPFLVAADELDLPLQLRIPETENHRLMIETSRYLTNAKMLAEQRQMGIDCDDCAEEQSQVREWLLRTLRWITINDFAEYNARPYTRYSLNAILNLHDFTDPNFAGDKAASDKALHTASQIVLDLSGAKFAAGSNRGRRIVPFRRLAKYDERALYEMVEGSDHEVARALVLAGQTQLLGGGIDAAGFSNIIYPAVSPYHWPRPVLEVAVERRSTVAQDIHHAGIEGYFASPAFTMSLGGEPRPAALSIYTLQNDDDRGVAMPTVIITTSAGRTMPELFAMTGNGSRHERTANTCGWRGFICGIQPSLSTAYSPCTTGPVSAAGANLFFVNSAACPNIPLDAPFFLAAKIGQCDGTFCARGRQWGLMEVVEAPAILAGTDPRAFLAATFRGFQAARRPALDAAIPNVNGAGTYMITSGESVRFIVRDDKSWIADINGVPRRNFETTGDVINSERNGRVTISSPFSTAKVIIDFTKWDDPRRGELP